MVVSYCTVREQKKKGNYKMATSDLMIPKTKDCISKGSAVLLNKGVLNFCILNSMKKYFFRNIVVKMLIKLSFGNLRAVRNKVVILAIG